MEISRVQWLRPEISIFVGVDTIMGTPTEWLSVVAFGAFWAFFLLIWDLVSFLDWRSKLSLSGLVGGSCSVGMFHVFGWNALRGPKAVVFVSATVGAVLVGLAKLRALKAANESQRTP